MAKNVMLLSLLSLECTSREALFGKLKYIYVRIQNWACGNFYVATSDNATMYIKLI